MNAPRSQLNWYQYRLLIQIDNDDKREYYELEAAKNDTAVRYTLPENNSTILASQYQLYLPTEKQLAERLKKELSNLK